jgi:glucose-1-phosphate thymidylyltransferase
MSTRDATAAVILARGLGTRMRAATAGVALDAGQASAAAAGLKGLIPDSAGRPFLDHVLSSLADAGVTEVCLVVAPGHSPVRAHYEAHPTRRLRLAWAVQEEPLGTANALLAAEAWAAGREVLILNADNLYAVEAIRALVTLGEPGVIAFDPDALLALGNIPAARLAGFAALTMDAHGYLEAILEKPSAEALAALGATPWVGMNLWRVNAAVFSACRDVAPSPRGELELPLAILLAIHRGQPIRAVTMRAGVLDLSRQEDIPEVAARLGARECSP